MTEINQQHAVELEALISNYLTSITSLNEDWTLEYAQRVFESACPALAELVRTLEFGVLETEVDLSRWPIVEGIDCSPENVRQWVRSREAYRADAVKLRGILNDVLEEVYNGAERALNRVASIKEDMRG